MIIKFEKKFFSFKLFSSVKNSKKTIISRKGWIIKLKDKKNNKGYGEVSPLIEDQFNICEEQLNQIPLIIKEDQLMRNINNFHPCIQSGVNSALAEVKGILKFLDNYEFNNIYTSAILLNSESALKEIISLKKKTNLGNQILTIKWKVGIKGNKYEEKVLEEILGHIKSNFRIRIDANGSWSRKCADRWAEILKDNKNLDWLEQPLHEDDLEGLKILNDKIPVALDESLIKYPQLINDWNGWQIRRPSQECNPLDLLNELENKKGFRAISTSFETGIGRRLLFHCSYKQLLGSTPKVPGLGLKQIPDSFLFSQNPKFIWNNL
tara:strand:- start:872 stop:1837 length:966 start_codon:yes stop_codon:yes gene_type:complete